MALSMWQGQVALVSGAGSESGIGLAIARRLGREGVRVLITASSARIQQRVAELQAEGIDARAMTADLTDELQVKELADWAHEPFGQIDILVNNAGMAMVGSPESFVEVAAMDLATWNLSLARNLTSAFLLTRAVLPGMKTRGYGRIVHISSTTGKRGINPGESAYSAAKAAMLFWRLRKPAISPVKCWWWMAVIV
jgi:3-oxoacyl-[acyl-carrier protein] reductase